jgi:two-component system cell cycle sensor histidine kinase/response regulator CckA
MEIIAIRPDVPIVLCTGYSNLISEDKAKAIGIRALVMKPLSMANVATTIRDLLDDGV